MRRKRLEFGAFMKKSLIWQSKLTLLNFSGFEKFFATLPKNKS